MCCIVLILIRLVVPEVHSVDPKGSATSYQGNRGYMYVMATLKYTYFLN